MKNKFVHILITPERHHNIKAIVGEICGIFLQVGYPFHVNNIETTLGGYRISLYDGTDEVVVYVFWNEALTTGKLRGYPVHSWNRFNCDNTFTGKIESFLDSRVTPFVS